MQHRGQWLTVFFLLVALVAGLDSTLARQADVRKAIEAGNAAFGGAIARGDAKAIAAMYSAGALVFPPNGDIVRGGADIQKLWQSVIDMGITSATLTVVDVESHADWAHEVGTFEMKTADGKVADRGKYVVIWKREGGQWKLHRDIWNTSLPAGKT